MITPNSILYEGVLFIGTPPGENKGLLIRNGTVFYFVIPRKMANIMTLVSKGNGKNYYGFDAFGIHEIVKIKGAFYRTAYKHGQLIPVGDAIPKSQYFISNE